MGFVFYDNYYPIDVGGASMGGGGQHERGGGRVGKNRARKGANTGEGGARARKDRARESLTGALCTKFTLVSINEGAYLW
jgi:hypothetical protein